MPAIDRLLKRWGFVRLSRYGLVLTPEDRVMSLRPSILDDGLRGKVVGWQDDDLAAAELKPWESPVKPSVATLVAQPVAPPSRPTMPMPIAVAPVALTPVAAAPARPTPAPAPVRPTPAPASVAQSVAPPAQPHMVEADEWEWEIALARVRAAADQVEEAARSPIARAPSPVRRPAAAAPAPAVAARAASSPSEIASRLRPVQKTKPIAAVAPVRETDARPRSNDSELVFAPAPRRLAKGTVTPKPTQIPSVRPRPAHADEPTVAEFSLSEHTVTQLSYDSDHTTPHLPLLDRTKPGVALPSIRGRLAR